MVNSYTGACLSTAFSLLLITECIISLDLLELHVPPYVELGASAQLSCRWSLGPADVLYSVKWYKDGKEFFRHVPRDSEPRRKFSLPGVDVEYLDSSGSRILLSPVVFETAGRYRCEVSGERPLFPTVSEYADMDVVVLPDEGPVITGLKRRYRPDDRLQVNCTSGKSRPACQLAWYINGEPAPTEALLPTTHYGDEQLTTTLQLNLKLTDEYFAKNGIKVKCLATLVSLYWRSNEESALLEKQKKHENLLPKVQVKKETHSRAARVHTEHAFRSSTLNIMGVLFAYFCK